MAKPWFFHKRSIKYIDKNLPTEEEILDKIETIPHSRNRYFIATLYYTAGRISEVIHFYKVSLTTKHSRMLNKYVDVVEIYMPNEKTRGKQDMKVIPLNLELERRELVIKMFKYLYKIQYEPRKWGFLSKERGWQILRRTTRGWFDVPLNPHILRHIRTSHLTLRGYHPEVIRRLAGWQSVKMYTERYSHLNVSDLI